MILIVLRPITSSVKFSLKNNQKMRTIKDNYTIQTSVWILGNRNVHTTIDKTEVEKFSVSMKEWWDLKGNRKVLHVMNKVRVPFIKDGMLQNSTANDSEVPLKDKNILDVGCGGGILSEALAEIGANVTGIDSSEELIKLAEQHKNINKKIANNKPTYYYTTIEKHIEKFDNYYDGVVASEVLEHVNNPELFVKSCIEALKPGGNIFITTPNRTWYSWFVGIHLAENVFGVIPKGTHEYKKFITPKELNEMMEKYNCKKQMVYGFNYRPVKEEWSVVKSTKLVYGLQAIKLN